MTTPPATTEPPTSRVDRAAVIAVLAGVAIVLGGWRDPVTLGAGLALGLGGVLLALRLRTTTTVTPERSYAGGLLTLALTLAVVRVVVAFLLDLQIGELLADGAGLTLLDAEGRRYAIALRVLRDLECFTAIAFLVAALLRWRRRPA